MGVTRGFWNVLKPVARLESLESLRGKVLAIDLSFWMIQLLSRVKGIFIRKPHLRLLFFRTIHLIVKVGASPVFVVDGEPPPLKWAVRLNRFSRISGVPLSSSIGEADCNAQPSRNNHFKCSVDECVKLLELLGMPVLRAKHEAEGLCAELQKQGLVDACVTPDSDAFLYGAEHVIKIFQVDLKDPHVESYMMKDIESFLGLHREHLVALALLAGCDYNVSGVPGIGCHSAVRLIKVVPKDEVLGRLEDWGAGRFAIGSENGSMTADFTISGRGKESITSRSIESTSVRKDHHCSRCGHPGTIRSHVKLGCEKCLSEASSRCMDEQGCRPKGKDFKCTCEYCMRMESIKRNCKEEDWKLKICQKISATRGFPNKSIIEIFMSPESETLGGISRPSLTCKSPNLEALEEFLEMQLHWEKSYVRRKLLPLLSFYCLRETAAMRSSPNPFIRVPSINGIYVPHSIQRIKILFSKPLYRLRWAQSTATNSQDDWLDLYMPPNSYVANSDYGLDLMVSDLQTERIGNNLLFTTDEDMMLVKDAYPDIVLEFEKEQELLRSKKKAVLKKKKNTDDLSCKQLRITSFFQARKEPCQITKENNESMLQSSSPDWKNQGLHIKASDTLNRMELWLEDSTSCSEQKIPKMVTDGSEMFRRPEIHIQNTAITVESKLNNSCRTLRKIDAIHLNDVSKKFNGCKSEYRSPSERVSKPDKKGNLKENRRDEDSKVVLTGDVEEDIKPEPWLVNFVQDFTTVDAYPCKARKLDYDPSPCSLENRDKHSLAVKQTQEVIDSVTNTPPLPSWREVYGGGNTRSSSISKMNIPGLSARRILFG